MTRLLGAILLCAVATGAAGQSPVASFEAATIKINKEAGFVAGLDRSAGGRFVVTNLPLSTIIGFAWQLDRFELQGGPDWIRSDRWDVVAKMAGDFPPTPPGAIDPAALAMRELLAERFKVSLRRETRDVDVYFLVKTRAENTPGLRPSTTDCGALQKARDAAARGGPPATDPNTQDRVVCGARNNGRRIQIGGYPMTTLADTLGRQMERRVVDRTGLAGSWEVDVAFAPPQATPGAAADPDSPSLATALQERLGLRLESGRMSMPVTVVDRVERPVAD